MEFVIGHFINRSEEDLEGVALHECREVEWKNVMHHVPVMQFSTDHNAVVLTGYLDLSRREGGVGLREPGLAEWPGDL